jgi:hypothetical protein
VILVGALDVDALAPGRVAQSWPIGLAVFDHAFEAVAHNATEKTKPLGTLLVALPILFGITYRFHKICAQTNFKSGPMMVRKWGFTREESDPAGYKNTFLRLSREVTLASVVTQFVNMACSPAAAAASGGRQRVVLRARDVASLVSLQHAAGTATRWEAEHQGARKKTLKRLKTDQQERQDYVKEGARELKSAGPKLARIRARLYSPGIAGMRLETVLNLLGAVPWVEKDQIFSTTIRQFANHLEDYDVYLAEKMLGALDNK